jgi:acyl carrier protein
MSEQEDRLLRCFAAVFPTLSEWEIRACDVVALFDLDSLAGVNLTTLIDQEFGANVDIADLLSLGSFTAIGQFLRERNPSNLSLHERETEMKDSWLRGFTNQ